MVIPLGLCNTTSLSVKITENSQSVSQSVTLLVSHLKQRCFKVPDIVRIENPFTQKTT